ncbi:putative integral membrane protein [Podospora didyma]|uniref:Integral membrane protein n=1 Tax=Podospora didyma TaxID=330526 RepID=A0AAE0N2V0_9PEZI|nr:putative integral membrane protein [Podospora didyma]
MSSNSSPPAVPALPPNTFDDRSSVVLGTVAFCLLWATMMVGLRLWTRGKILKELGVDDYACIAGLLATYGSGIAIAHMTKYGLGKHVLYLVYFMDATTIPMYLRDFYVSIVFYCAALLAIKLSFLFQYYRVLAVQHMRLVYIGAIVIVGGWALSQLLVGIFICTPIEGFWDSTIPSKCIPNIPQWYINAAGNIITDLAVFILPLPAIWKLNLVKPQKIMLLCIFSLGFFTVVISMIRIRYLHLYEDFPWENVVSSCWSIGELTSAITCLCLPTLRPLLSHYFPALGTQAGRSHQGYGKGSALASSQKPESERGDRRKGDASGWSEVELAVSPTGPRGNSNSNPFETHSINTTSEDGSIGESDLPQRQHSLHETVGLSSTVKTTIQLAKPEAVHKQNPSLGGGVQVQREVHQDRSPNLARGYN